jgi:RNA polymerase sigma-70 factor (ECF subfamily)
MTAAGEILVDRRIGLVLEDEDDRLHRAAVAGDDSAFERLVHRHSPQAALVARRLLENPQDVEDAVQETFVRAYQGLRRYRGQAGFRAWLLAIVVNVCRNRRRDWWRWRTFLSRSGLGGPEPDARKQAEQQLIRGDLDRLVSALPDALRVPFTLRFFEELSGAEIAAILECPESTVWTRIYSARRELQRRLAKLENEPGGLK